MLRRLGGTIRTWYATPGFLQDCAYRQSRVVRGVAGRLVSAAAGSDDSLAPACRVELAPAGDGVLPGASPCSGDVTPPCLGPGGGILRGRPGGDFGQRRRRLPGESGKCRSSPAGSVQACASIRRPSHSMVVEWPLDPELLETTGDFPEALKSLLPIGLGPVLVWAGLAMGGDTRELVRGAGLCSVIEFDMPRIWRCVWGRSRHLKPNGVLGLQVGWMC